MVVVNGVLKGEDLNKLIEDFNIDLLGKKVVEVYGREFLLFFKFIDVREDLLV